MQSFQDWSGDYDVVSHIIQRWPYPKRSLLHDYYLLAFYSDTGTAWVPLPGGNAPSEVHGGWWDLVCMEMDQPDLCQEPGMCSCSGWASAFLCSRNDKKPECPQGQQKIDFLFILPGTFCLPVTLIPGLVMSLLAPSGVKGNYRGSAYLWCGIQGIPMDKT